MNKIDEERIGVEHQEKQLKDFSVFAAGEQRRGSRFCKAQGHNI